MFEIDNLGEIRGAGSQIRTVALKMESKGQI